MQVHRLFLDTSILFSVAQANSGLSLLYRLAESGKCLLFASRYVIEKAKRNLRGFEQTERLHGFLSKVNLVLEVDDRMECPVSLPQNVKAVLMAAMLAKMDYLLTGDNEHFGQYQGQTLMGVRIMGARDYLQISYAETDSSKPESIR